jgi:hypothetical protein
MEERQYVQKIRPRVTAVYVTEDNVDEVAEWCGGSVATLLRVEGDQVWVWLKDGSRADVGSYVIRDGGGRFSRLDALSFEALWEGLD